MAAPMPSKFPDPRRHPARAPRGARVFTPALTVFLAVVGLIVVVGLRGKYPRPPIGDAVLLLADGDLDGAERQRLLRITIDGALGSSELHHRWAGLVAAVALDDRTAYERLRTLLGGVEPPSAAPAAPHREFLGLGDPLLHNFSAALCAEAEGRLAEARRLWQQVANQCRLQARPFAAELAAAALQRLS